MLKKKRETEIILSMDISHIFFEEPSKRAGSSCSSLKKNRIDLAYKENWARKPYIARLIKENR